MKVLVADDHPIFRASLKQVLKDIDADVIVIEAGNFSEAAELATKNMPLDLVLLDLMMPGKEPIEELRAMVERVSEVPVIVVSAIENRRDTLNMIDIGAMGYIPKTANHDEFIKMVRVVLSGGLCLPRHFAEWPKIPAPQRGVEQIRHQSNELLAGLTRRQKQVLALLARGKSNMEIAEDLGVSDKTVRFYISAILKTLKVRNRTQAALIAARAIDDVGDDLSHGLN